MSGQGGEPGPTLTHLDEAGRARMVDVGDKPITRRQAVASAVLRARPETVAAIAGRSLAKGDALATARVAGIMAAKRTAELIPLCHPLPLDSVQVDFELDQPAGRVAVRATARCTGRTGVEMEVMVAASVSALCLYDMCKAIDRWMTIEAVQLEEKSGGRSGELRRGERP